jgi:NTP pyrophosphatase (non-canonical NTP hydrolase)
MAMSDSETTVSELRELVEEFVTERDWQPFHTPKNISMALAIEASELMEHFQWMTTEQSTVVRDDAETFLGVREELADVVTYGLALANRLDIDLAATIEEKMVKNRQKYPLGS